MADHPDVSDTREVADVAIIGAGVIGCSVAFHLTRLGCRNVLLIDKEPLPGSGSTSKANGGIRAQFTTDVNIAMSLASMDILDALADEIGEPPVYRKAGYLFLTSDPGRFSAMKTAAAFQRARGVSVEVLDAEGVRAKAPYAAGEIAGGTFGARDGFIDAGALTNFFLREATRAGVRTRYGAEVTAIVRDGSGTFRLTTTAGALRASAVVDAAGPFAGRVAALVGADVPVVPVRRHILISGPCKSLPPVIPMTIDADTGVLIRREGNRVLIAYSNPDEPPGFNSAFDPDFPLRIAEHVDARFPAVGEAGLDIRRSWAGLYEVTPDHHAVIGPVSGVPGFFVVAGFSGHGIMHAPAAGRAAAEMLVGGRSESIDVSALSLERFARGEAIHETMVL
ncbi:MAG TPA: FAD-dependent oxidoreductase [Thermoanaerobaculia bacterium]